MILDTNALAAWREGDRDILPRVAPSSRLAVPVVVIGEYRYGARKSSQRPDIDAWLNQVIKTVRVLTLTVDTADSYADIRGILDRKGRPIPANDAWIAALALQHRLPVLSRDNHFDVVDGLTRVSW